MHSTLCGKSIRKLRYRFRRDKERFYSHKHLKYDILFITRHQLAVEQPKIEKKNSHSKMSSLHLCKIATMKPKYVPNRPIQPFSERKIIHMFQFISEKKNYMHFFPRQFPFREYSIFLRHKINNSSIPRAIKDVLHWQ